MCNISSFQNEFIANQWLDRRTGSNEFVLNKSVISIFRGQYGCGGARCVGEYGELRARSLGWIPIVMMRGRVSILRTRGMVGR